MVSNNFPDCSNKKTYTQRILTSLAQEGIKDRHWVILSEKIGVPLEPQPSLWMKIHTIEWLETFLSRLNVAETWIYISIEREKKRDPITLDQFTSDFLNLASVWLAESNSVFAENYHGNETSRENDGGPQSWTWNMRSKISSSTHTSKSSRKREIPRESVLFGYFVMVVPPCEIFVSRKEGRYKTN